MSLRSLGDGVWARAIDFYPDAYVEYGFSDGGRRVRDPLNRRARRTFLRLTNHFFYMPAGRPTPLARVSRAPRGSIERVDVDASPYAGSPRRRVHLYTPPVRGRLPLLVALDGDEYLRRARLATIADNLIAQHRIRPIAIAFVQGGGRARVLEYACNEATLEMLLERVLPLARERIDLERSAGGHGILGSSLGGLMALFAGLRAPRVFGKVLSQSGSFALGGRDFVVFDLVRSLPRRPLRIWMDVGHLETLRAPNRRMRRALAARGYDVTYREYHAGHHWPAWRDEVWRGLETLFAP